MSISIDVGSDLFGTKVNMTLTFPQRPTVAELTATSESHFDTKARAIRPAGYPDVPFKIETFQLFDDTLLRWVDLYNEQQLRSGAQLWCFQPESIWHSDAQGVIPQPEKPPVTWTTPLGSPRRARIAADAGVPPTLSEKLRSVFYQIDGTNKGFLLFQDLDTAFRRCDMQFNHGTAGDLFTLADQNRSQHITYDEWVNFAVKCPSIVDALFFRMRDMGPSTPHSPPGVDAQIARQSELKKMYSDSWANSNRPQQEREFEEARLRETQKRRTEVERAMNEHSHAIENAQMAVQQHAQQHAAARQAASQQSAAMDAAQQALRSAEQAAQQAAAQEAAARNAHEQAMSSKASAERALQQAQAERMNAQQQADAEAAAQYAAERHMAQEQEARRQAEAAMQAVDHEMQNANAAQQAARAAAQAAHEAAQAQASAQQAMAQAQQLKEQAQYEQQQLQNVQQRQQSLPQVSHMSHPSSHVGHTNHSMPSPGADNVRRDYESAKRRADELRRMKEEAEREEREAWNKLYYSPASPHFGNSPSH